jgi:methionyl-tRNA synthetase
VIDDSVRLYREAMDELALDAGCRHAFRIVDATNEFIASSEPWVLAKQEDQRPLDVVLWSAAEALRVAAVLLSPVIPESATEILARLGVDRARLSLGEDLALRPDGERRVERRPAMWPRLESAQQQETLVTNSNPSNPPAPAPSASAPAAPAAQATPASPQAPPAKADDRISIDDFMKIDLRVARIVSAERVPNSKKLMKLEIDLGSERRTLVAGIAEAYDADALVGRHVAIVANLKPAKLMGIESNGMVLAASPDGGKPILVSFDTPPAPGTRVR